VVYILSSGGHDFMDKGEMKIDGRSIFHYVATGITPAMSMPKVGTGSAYAFTPHDADGNYLDGGKTYKVTLARADPREQFLVIHGVFWSTSLHAGDRSKRSRSRQQQSDH
jgi:hypothetical protein